jgi:hypothetical protein
MHIGQTLIACEDCCRFVANGDVPEDRPTISDDIRARITPATTVHLVNATDEDDNPTGEDWFSWSPCECCGSPLGGMRNHLAVLTAE